MLAFTVWMVVWFWFCGPHLIGKDWFERGLFNWGYATGTFATGFCLLRVVDPNNRSTALSDTAILTPFEHVVEITAAFLGTCTVVDRCGMVLPGRGCGLRSPLGRFYSFS